MADAPKYRNYRIPCSMPVQLRVGELTLDATMLNVTTSGMRVEAPPSRLAGVPRGSRIGVAVLGTTFDAEVAWARAGQLGLRLLAPLGTRTMERLRARRPGQRPAGAGHHGFREMG